MKTFLTMLVAAAAVIPFSANSQQLTLTNPSPTRPATNSQILSPLSAGTPSKSLPTHPAITRATRASSDYIYTIVEEDFSGFTEGSQDALSTDYLGVAGEPYIDNTLTQSPGWSTLYGVQADGAIALNSPIGGCLNTPMGDYAGKITVEFRMRIPSGFGTVGVMIANDGIWSPGILDGQTISLDPEESDDSAEWHYYKLEFDNPYSNDDCFVQFCAYYCQAIIDDIRICSDLSSSIDAPKAKGTYNFTRDGFTANWSSVRSADNYYLNVFRELQTGEPWTRTEDFSDGLPAGWTAEGGVAPASEGGTNNSPCLRITDNTVITSPLFDERLRSVEIWFRLLEGESYFSTLKVQGFDGANWIDMGELYLQSLPDDEEGGRLLISGRMNPKHHDRYYQLRFVFKGFADDLEYGMEPVLALDDIQIVSMPSRKREYAIKELPVENNSYTVSGLDSESDYYYYLHVTRADGVEAIGSPELAFGISSPSNPAVSDVTDKAYTASWDYTPKATGYHVRDFGVLEAAEAETDYPVLHETFRAAAEAGGDFDEPLMLNNPYDWKYLDSYTDNAGWIGGSTLIGDGCVGTGGGMLMQIRTPELTLDNGDGTFSVKVQLYSLAEDGILITPSSAKADYIGFEVQEGWNEVTLLYGEGSHNEVLTFSAQNSTPFFLSEVEVNQSLNKGDEIYTFMKSAYIAGGENTTHTFSNVDFKTFGRHAFDVCAIYEKEYSDCTSELTERIAAGSANGITSAKHLGAAIVKALKGGVEVMLGEPAEVDYITIDGRVGKHIEAPAGRTFTELPSGLWIVRIGNHAYKLLVK